MKLLALSKEVSKSKLNLYIQQNVQDLTAVGQVKNQSSFCLCIESSPAGEAGFTLIKFVSQH